MESYRELLADMMENGLSEEDAVAKQGDDVVGFLFCSISRMSGYTYGTSPLYGYVSDTYVLPEYRRLGAAAQLFDFTRQWLQESEVEYVELKVLESNEKAHMFWQRQGFEPTTRVYGMKI